MRFCGRRPRIFISYAHEDGQEKLRELVTWLQLNGIVTVYDERIHPGRRLDLTIREYIDRCDGILALGTPGYMKSDWGEDELRYAYDRGTPKPCCPVLVDPLPLGDTERWFVSGGGPEGNDIKIAMCHAQHGWDELQPFVEQMAQCMPLGLSCKVGAILTTLIIVPTLILMVTNILVGQAGDAVRRQRQLVEQLNSAALLSSPTSTSPALRITLDTPQLREWRQPGSDQLVLRDIKELGIVKERHYFEHGDEIAVDTTSVSQGPNGSLSLVKDRRITPKSADPVVIEEKYDSTGMLISGQVRSQKGGRVYRYPDVARSLYPLITRNGYRP